MPAISPTGSPAGRAAEQRLPLVEAQHHHAHVAACLAENGWPLSAPKALGVALDGLGLGDDGEIWGGEFLLADYRGYQRLGTLKPVAMIGGDQASREPWRNLYAHLTAERSWTQLRSAFGDLPALQKLEAKPRALLDAMVKSGVNAPLAWSCGRLFDAMAAALGLGWEAQSYEGEAASRLEASVDERALRDEAEELGYPMSIGLLKASRLPYLEPLAMWDAALGDLALGTPGPIMAARFHRGLAKAIAAMVVRLASRDGGREAAFDTVALTGGCFQNRSCSKKCSVGWTSAASTCSGTGKFPPTTAAWRLAKPSSPPRVSWRRNLSSRGECRARAKAQACQSIRARAISACILWSGDGTWATLKS